MQQCLFRRLQAKNQSVMVLKAIGFLQKKTSSHFALGARLRSAHLQSGLVCSHALMGALASLK